MRHETPPRLFTSQSITCRVRCGASLAARVRCPDVGLDGVGWSGRSKAGVYYCEGEPSSRLTTHDAAGTCRKKRGGVISSVCSQFKTIGRRLVRRPASLQQVSRSTPRGYCSGRTCACTFCRPSFTVYGLQTYAECCTSGVLRASAHIIFRKPAHKNKQESGQYIRTFKER